MFAFLRKSNRDILFPALLLLLTACGDGTGDVVTSVHINVADAADVEVDTNRMVRLEAGDSSRLYGIDNLFECDGRLVVRSRNYLRMFDATDGRYLGDMARRGEGEHDFSNISNMWQRGDTVYFFDCNAGILHAVSGDLSYRHTVRPLDFSSIPAIAPPRMLFEAADGGYYTVNGSTGGSTRQNPLVSEYTRDGKYMAGAKGRDVVESSFFLDGAVSDPAHGRLLLWEPLRDTVFAVDKKGIYPLLAFDFGKNAMPSGVQNLKPVHVRAEAFTKKRNPAYASMLRYVQPDGEDLYFCFASGDGKCFVARYNTTDGEVVVRSYNSPDGRYTQTTFMKVEADSLLLELRDNLSIEANPIVYSVPKSDFYASASAALDEEEEISRECNGINLMSELSGVRDYKGNSIDPALPARPGNIILRFSATACRPCIEGALAAVREYLAIDSTRHAWLFINNIRPRELYVMAPDFGPRFSLMKCDSLSIDFDWGNTPVIFGLDSAGTVRNHFTCRPDDPARTARFVSAFK